MSAASNEHNHGQNSADQRTQRDESLDRAHIRREALHIALVLGALTALLAIAIGAAYFDFGAFSPVIAMTLSAIKALLVATIFMRLAREPGVVRLFAAAGLFWLTILFTLALADYQTRPARATDRATDHAEAPPPSASRPAAAARMPPDRR